MKKILIDARFWGPQDTGLGRYTMNLVRELAKLDKISRYCLLVRDKACRQDLVPWPANFKLLVAPAHPYSLRAQWQVAKLLAQHRPDLTHVPHGGLPVLTKGKLVITVHDLIKDRWSDRASTTRTPLVHWLKLKTYQLNLSAGLRKARAVIVPSEVVKSQLEEKCPDLKGRVRVVYEGIDEVFKSPPLGQTEAVLKRYRLTKPFVIYVGNIYPYKNIPTLIKAVQLARPELPGLILTVACARSVFAERLEAQIKTENREDQVKILGFVPDRDLAVLYQEALALVSASLDEGFGITPLEALAAGGQAVVSATPIFQEICGEAARYFDPRQPDQLAAILTGLGRGKLEKRRSLVRNRYQWARMAEEIKEIYDEVMA